MTIELEKRNERSSKGLAQGRSAEILETAIAPQEMPGLIGDDHAISGELGDGRQFIGLARRGNARAGARIGWRHLRRCKGGVTVLFNAISTEGCENATSDGYSRLPDRFAIAVKDDGDR